MELSELVLKRRSIRAYEKASIPVEDIEEIVRCAQLAPSWKNSQTGRYYVALSDEAIDQVFETLPDFNRRSSANAAYITATFRKGISGCGNDGFADEYGDMWGAYDLGLQNAYMLLKARELGYDTLIMGLRDEAKLREYFGIPEDEALLPVIAIGKGEGEPRANKRKELDEILKIL